MKISIITVTYNSALFVNYCLDSVKLQKYENIEHIVVDGASTDKTLSLLNARRDQIHVLVSEKDKGIYDAMNKGINLAKGDIIGFLNSDDIYASNKVLSKVASLFNNNPMLDACYADLIYVDQFDISKTVRYVKSRKFEEGLFLKGWCPPHPTFFVRRSIYDRLGKFDLNYRIASDVDLMMRFLEKYKIKSRYINEVWVKMRMGGTTNKSLKNIWLQNIEILNSFDKNSISLNLVRFFLYKFISRFFQFVNKQP